MKTNLATRFGSGLAPLLAPLLTLVLGVGSAGQAAENGFTVTEQTNRLVIADAGQPVATYVFRDDRILRPYFANLHAPGGIQVTRRHPPIPGQDATDHDTMHPGVWMAFGDINGHDFWRNKASIRHRRFVERIAVRNGQMTFAAENELRSAAGEIICTQTSRIRLRRVPAGYLLVWEAAFKSDQGDFTFGDQEEMGLGVRVATALTEKNGGVITSSTGATTAKRTWGKAFDWCDYSGLIDHQRAGVMLMPGRENFRPSWWHNRDYGLMVANPFGRQAMKQGAPSRVTVKQGEIFRLRFGVLLHGSRGAQPLDLAEAYRRFLQR